MLPPDDAVAAPPCGVLFAVSNGSAGERRAHQDDGSKHVGPHQRAPGRDRSAEVVPDNRGHRAMAQRRYESERIAGKVEKPKRSKIAVVVGIPARGAPITSLVGRHDVKPRGCERHHQFSPGIGQLRKTVEQQDAGSVFLLESGLQHVHAQAVDAGHEAGADAGRQHGVFQGWQLGHVRVT